MATHLFFILQSIVMPANCSGHNKEDRTHSKTYAEILHWKPIRHTTCFVVNGGTGGCHNDNPRYYQWRLSEYHDNFRFPVCVCVFFFSAVWCEDAANDASISGPHGVPSLCCFGPGCRLPMKEVGLLWQVCLYFFWRRSKHVYMLMNACRDLVNIIKHCVFSYITAHGKFMMKDSDKMF